MQPCVWFGCLFGYRDQFVLNGQSNGVEILVDIYQVGNSLILGLIIALDGTKVDVQLNAWISNCEFLVTYSIVAGGGFQCMRNDLSELITGHREPVVTFVIGGIFRFTQKEHILFSHGLRGQ